MNDNPIQQVFSDLLGYLESLETQTGAILEFLKGKGMATDEQLAPHLEQASAAASVKWRAVRVRMERLFALSQQAPAESAPKQKPAESPAKAEAPTAAKESNAPKKAADVRPDPSKEPPKKSEGQGATDDGKAAKDVAVRAPEQSTSSTQKKTTGESDHSEVEQQKAS